MPISHKKSVRKYFFARFFWCAVHGNQLGGASPLWGYVIANH